MDKQSRFRWRIAHLLDKLPGQCWSDLVDWAMKNDNHWNPWSPVRDICRRDVATTGGCYCGKLIEAPDGHVHLCPPVGEALMPCCGRTPFELPDTDRMTLNRRAVTCAGTVEVAP